MLRSPIRGPSIKALSVGLHIRTDQAARVKTLMLAGKPTSALQEANRAMNGHGVESLWPDYPNFRYVNMGDTYDTTLCYTGQSFHVGSWGDWVERHPAVAHDGSNPRNSRYWRGKRCGGR